MFAIFAQVTTLSLTNELYSSQYQVHYCISRSIVVAGKFNSITSRVKVTKDSRYPFWSCLAEFGTVSNQLLILEVQEVVSPLWVSPKRAFFYTSKCSPFRPCKGARMGPIWRYGVDGSDRWSVIAKLHSSCSSWLREVINKSMDYYNFTRSLPINCVVRSADANM